MYNIPLSKRVLVKIPVSSATKRGDVQITVDSLRRSFHIEVSPFDKSRRVVFKAHYPLKSFTIKLGSAKRKVTLNEGTQFSLSSGSDSRAYLELRLYNKNFLTFLDKYCVGRTYKEIRIEKDLFSASKKHIMAAFSALVDADGSLDYYGHTRRLRVRTTNREYLSDWRELLDMIGVISRLGNDGKLHQLTITSWQNFNLLNSLGFAPKHSRKSIKWEQILNSYQKKQVIRNRAIKYYTESIARVGKPVTAFELAKQLGKSKRTICHQLTKLKELGIIASDYTLGNGSRPPTYWIVENRQS